MRGGSYFCSHWIPASIPLVWKVTLFSTLPIGFSFSRSVNIHVPCSPWESSLQILCLFKASTQQTLAASSPLTGWATTDQVDRDCFIISLCWKAWTLPQDKEEEETSRRISYISCGKTRFFYLAFLSSDALQKNEQECLAVEWKPYTVFLFIMPHQASVMLIPVCLFLLKDLSDSPRCLLCTNLYSWAAAESCGMPTISDGVQELLLPNPAFREQVAAATLQVLLQLWERCRLCWRGHLHHMNLPPAFTLLDLSQFVSQNFSMAISLLLL